MDGIVTPIAILLVVSSSKGNTIPFRWPPRPSRRQRTEQPDWKTSQGAIKGSAFGGGWNAGRRASEQSSFSDASSESSEDDNEAFFPVQQRASSSRKLSAATEMMPSPLDDNRRSRKLPYRDSSQPSSRASSIHFGHSRAPSQVRNRTLSNDAPSKRGMSPSVSSRPLPMDNGSSSPVTGLSDSATLNGGGTMAPSTSVDEYHTYLSFPTTFLAHILTPKEEICQQRFDLAVDDLCFIGHPIRRDGSDKAGGGWGGGGTATDEERILSPATGPVGSGGGVERGRVKGSRLTIGNMLNLDSGLSSPAVGRTQGASLPNVTEGKTLNASGNASGSGPRPPPSAPSTASAMPIQETPDKDVPSISFFHLVLVCDQPDGSQKGPLAPERKLEAVYKEVVFKVTAALLESQIRDNWVAQQGTELYNLRDTCLQELVPWDTFYEKALQLSPLARALRKVFEAICAYPFSTNVTIGGLPFYVQLPLLPPSADLNWALWEDQNPLGDGEDSEDDEEAEELYLTLDRSSTIRLAPWKALLLLDETSLHAHSAGHTHGRVSRSDSGGYPSEPRGRLDSIGGGGPFGGFWPQGSMTALPGPGTASAPDSQTNTPRPGGTPLMKPLQLDSEVTSVAEPRHGDELPLEEESTPLFKMFLAAIKPNITLAEIARLPNFVDAGINLKRDLYPLARRLVWKRRARIILPIKPGTRNIYLPSTSRGKNMAALVQDFDERFPELAPLLNFYSRLSAAPVPYGTLNTDPKKKKIFYEALLWLLRADLVVIAPVRVRLQIRKEVKERARANLMETRKRLERELEVEKESAQRRNLEELIDAMPDEAEFSLLEEDVSVIASPIDCRGIERAWIEAMSHDKSPADADLFRRVRRYFDGITTTHEIQYREDISRRELNHILRIYEEDLITTIHP